MTTATSADDSGERNISISLTADATREFDRIKKLTGMATDGECLRRAFTLLRIHADARAAGDVIKIHTPDDPSDERIINLPF